MDATEIERRLVERTAATDEEALSGPVHIMSTEEGADGRATYHVSASRLVPIDDQDPELAQVSIPVPITAAVEVDGSGKVLGIDVPPPDAEATRQARAYTRTLIANGAVKGMPGSGPVRRGPGPPTHSTHEVTTDEFGRRVIRRTGFTMAAPLDATVHDGDVQHDHEARRGATR